MDCERGGIVARWNLGEGGVRVGTKHCIKSVDKDHVVKSAGVRDACDFARVDYDGDCLLVGIAGVAGQFARDLNSVRANVCRRWGVRVQGDQSG